MKKATSLITAAILLALAAGPARALPFFAGQPAAPAAATEIVQVQGSCYAVGQQVAAQYGGQLADVRMENRGGRTVCVGVVVVQGRNGERGRRIPFEVPL